MVKKYLAIILIVFAIALIAGCKTQQPEEPQIAEGPQPQQVEPKDEIVKTGQETVDEVGQDISEIGDIEEGLDVSELDEVDQILEDIESI